MTNDFSHFHLLGWKGHVASFVVRCRFDFNEKKVLPFNFAKGESSKTSANSIMLLIQLMSKSLIIQREQFMLRHNEVVLNSK